MEKGNGVETSQPEKKLKILSEEQKRSYKERINEFFGRGSRAIGQTVQERTSVLGETGRVVGSLKWVVDESPEGKAAGEIVEEVSLAKRRNQEGNNAIQEDWENAQKNVKPELEELIGEEVTKKELEDLSGKIKSFLGTEKTSFTGKSQDFGELIGEIFKVVNGRIGEIGGETIRPIYDRLGEIRTKATSLASTQDERFSASINGLLSLFDEMVAARLS